MKKKNGLVFLLISIMLFSILASMLSSIHIIRKKTYENSIQRTHILAAQIHDHILNDMIRPINVSQTMANDDSLIKLMERAKNASPKSIEEDMSDYLESIRGAFGYQMVFAVCEKTNAYYTYEGLSKILNPEKNDYDDWYKIFIDSGKYYDLDVDVDDANNWDLSVFVNVQIKDKDGNLLGICGVGVEMNHLQQLLTQYEEDYGVKINLIDHNKLVQVDTNRTRIEQAYLDVDNLSTNNPDKFSFKYEEHSIEVTSYMKDLDWFLVITDNDFQNISLLPVVLPSIIILAIGLIAMGTIFFIMYYRGKSMKGELSEKVEIEKKQMNILLAMSKIYLSSHLVNLNEDTVEELRTAEHVRFMVNSQAGAREQLEAAIRYTVEPAYVDAALKFTDLSTLKERMKGSKILMDQFVGIFNGWFRAQFIANTYDKDGEIETVIFTTQIIDAEKKQEEKLVRISLTDALTGLFNRRAYEKKLEEIGTEVPENLVIISMDINGLKTVNDTKGHEAGDELIRGAANCMMSAFISNGSIYRIGGDEFVAIIQTEKNEVNSIMEKFQKSVHEWHGMLTDELSISCGVVYYCEHHELGMTELFALADKCMYKMKKEHYRCLKKE